MLTRIFSLVGLILLVLLAALSLPSWIKALSQPDFNLAGVIMSGVVIILILAGAVMLMLFGVIGRHAPKQEGKEAV